MKKNQWKYDECKDIFYVPVGSFLCVARNARRGDETVTDSRGREHKIEVPEAYGEPFVVFYRERDFSDGSIALSEDITVAGGVEKEAVSMLRDELETALKML